MRLTRPRLLIALALSVLPAAATALRAQNSSPPDAAPAVRTQRSYLVSPRETLKTLYFAAVAYDIRPELLDEAVACLDLDAARSADTAEAARLAIDLEQILRTLCVPVHGVPDQTD